jgi:hypothetical protein
VPRKAKAKQQSEYVEHVAWELYEFRHKSGKLLNKNELWNEAEKIVRNPIRRRLFASHRPLIKLERKIWEPLLAWADNQALLSLLGIVGNAGLIIAVFTFIGTEKQRRDAEVLNAWQTITSAYGQSGNGGRIQALEFLNASPSANWRRKFPWFCTPLLLCTWPAERLDGINLGVTSSDTPSAPPEGTLDNDEQEGSYLAGIELPEASLVEANLTGANLTGANLRRANLALVNLAGADLKAANLEGANLTNANLEMADLTNTNLAGANLWSANLEGGKPD